MKNFEDYEFAPSKARDEERQAERREELKRKVVENTAAATGIEEAMVERFFDATDEVVNVYPLPYACVGTHLPSPRFLFNTRIYPVSQGVSVDVGASIGAFSFVATNYFEKVYAFEALKENYETFMMFLSSSHHINHGAIIPYNMAAGGSNEKDVKIYLNGDDVDSSSIYRDYGKGISPDKYNVVDQIDLETIFETIGEDKIDYLKVDIEGAEYEFLYNKDFSRVKYLSVELGEPPPGCSTTFREMSDHLTDNFFPMFVRTNHFFGINRKYIQHWRHNPDVITYAKGGLLDPASTIRPLAYSSGDSMVVGPSEADRTAVYDRLLKIDE